MFDVQAQSAKPFGSFTEATEYLEATAARLGARHLSYWCVSYADDTPDQVTWIATYDPAYMNHYMANYTPLGDPVFEMEAAIIDWADANAADATAQEMQDRAARFGIARNGFSVRFGEVPDLRILFSVNVACAEGAWPAEKARLLGPVQELAQAFHKRARPLVDSRRMAG
jgi:hypothetical protein